MWPKKLVFLVYMLLVLVLCENGKQYSRKPRLFTFNTVDDDVTVHLEFSVPFITIPAKKAMNSFIGGWGLPSINVNPASLAVGGAILLVTTVLIPLLAKSFVHQHPHQRYSKILESTEFSTDGFLEMASQILADSHALRGCALRIACWTSQKVGKESHRSWKQLLNNNILSSLINSTAIEDAMVSGRNHRDCLTYGPCPIKEEHLYTFTNSFASFSDSVG